MTSDGIPLLRASQLRPFIAAMRQIGAPSERYLREAKLPLLAHHDAHAVVPEVFAWNFVNKVARGEDVQDLGRFAAKVMPVWQSEPGFIHLLQSLPTLWIGLSTFCRLVVHFSNMAPFRVERAGERALFLRNRRPGIPGEAQAELYVVEIMIQLVQLAAGLEWVPPEVLVSDVNARRLVESEAFDGVRVRRSDTCTGVCFPAAMLARPMNALATEPGTPMPESLADDFVDSLRAAIGGYLRDRRPDIHLVAEMAGLSERTLQRRLGKAGLSFRALLDQVRLDQALSKLREPGARITEVAYDLGFSDAAHFTRAFRRWTALSPREFRHQHQLA